MGQHRQPSRAGGGAQASLLSVLKRRLHWCAQQTGANGSITKPGRGSHKGTVKNLPWNTKERAQLMPAHSAYCESTGDEVRD